MTLLNIVSIGLYVIMSKIVLGKFINVINLNSIIWVLSAFISLRFNNNYVQVDEVILTIIFLLNLITNLMYIIFHNESNFYKKNYKKNKSQDFYIKLLLIFAFFGFLIPFMNSIKLIRLYGFDLKIIRDFNYLFIDEIFSGVSIYLVKTLPTIILEILLVFLVTRTFNNNYEYILTILLLFISIFSYGGRKPLLFIVLFYIVHKIYQKELGNLRQNIKVLLSIFIMIAVISRFRSSNTDIKSTFFTYFSAPFSFYQYLIDTKLPTLDRTYGYLSFSFIIEPFLLFSKIFRRNLVIPSHLINNIVQPFYNIGLYTNKFYNNNTTSIFIWLWDFGRLGILIGPIILSSTVLLVEKMFDKNPNVYNYNFMIYTSSITLLSILEYPFTGISIFVFYFVKKIFERRVHNEY